MTDTTDINNTSAYDGANASAAADANLSAASGAKKIPSYQGTLRSHTLSVPE